MLSGRVIVPNPDSFVSDRITYEKIDFSRQILMFMAQSNLTHLVEEEENAS